LFGGPLFDDTVVGCVQKTGPRFADGNPRSGVEKLREGLTVVRILNEMAQRFGTAIIVVTHDEKIIPTFRRIYHIRDGRTYEQAGEARAA
jgi:ABC-type ATPase involved in cell division